MRKIFISVLLASLLLLTGCVSNDNGDAADRKDLDAMKEELLTINATDVEKAAGLPIFIIAMEDGTTMRGELYPDVAPQSVGNFIELANSGFYDGVIFHRVIPGFMIQGGDPGGTGTGGPGYTIKGEFNANGTLNKIQHERGVLSMARSNNYNSAGSQFFVMVERSTHLDGLYAAFGKVTQGIETADKIVSVERNASDKPLEEQKMLGVRVETFGVEYEFDKIK